MTPAPYVLSTSDWQALRAVQLDGLRRLDAICSQLGLRYQLAAGTLLGAVRHGGFVPWDDDVDVALPRADYDRLLREAPALLGPDWFLQHTGSDPGYHKQHAKLRRNHSRFVEASAAHRQHHHGIFLDVFPLDALAQGPLALALHLRGASLLHALQELVDHQGLPPGLQAAPGWQQQALVALQRTARHVPQGLRSQLHVRWLTLAARAWAGDQVACLATLPLGAQRARGLARPAAETWELVRLPFAGLQLCAPANHDQTLRRLYGDYWQLPPEAARVPRHRLVEFAAPT